MAKKKKKKLKLRIDRVIITLIVVIALVFGIYKGISFAVKQIQSLFHKEEVTQREPETPTKEPEKTYIATVVIDPGHGGWDGGANRDGVYEKDIVLKVSQAMSEVLENANIKAVFTRTSDEALADDKVTDLKLRAQASANNQANYFVSIHVNDFENSTDVSGFEVYTKDDNSKALAQAISQKLEALNYSQNRGIVDGHSLAVLRDNTVASVLVEMGYINGNDFNYLSDDAKLKIMGEEIAKGIVEMINAQ